MNKPPSTSNINPSLGQRIHTIHCHQCTTATEEFCHVPWALGNPRKHLAKPFLGSGGRLRKNTEWMLFNKRKHNWFHNIVDSI